mgnify:CR=1 FL=1
MKFSKAKPASDGSPHSDIAVPAFDRKSHISVDRRHGIIRRQKVTHAAAHDGAQLHEGLIDPNNTASDVWADTAYRSAANEQFLADVDKVSRIHRRKPRCKALAKHHARANAKKSAGRAQVEHCFGHQKTVMGFVVRTVGRVRAEAGVTLANMAFNMKRWCWLDSRAAPA